MTAPTAIILYDTRLWTEGDGSLLNLGSTGSVYDMPILTDLEYDTAYGTQTNDYYGEFNTFDSPGTGIFWPDFGGTPGVGGVFTFIIATGDTADGAGYAQMRFTDGTEDLKATIINWDGSIFGPLAEVTLTDPVLFADPGLDVSYNSSGAADNTVYFVEVDLTSASPDARIREDETVVDSDTHAAYGAGVVDGIYDPGVGVIFTLVGADTGWTSTAWRMRGMGMVRGFLTAAERDEWSSYFLDDSPATPVDVILPGAPLPTVVVYFDLSSVFATDYFTLNDTLRGKLDDTTYLLAGDLATDVTPYASAVSINRGRSRALDEFQAGTCEVVFRNESRIFDPSYIHGPFYGNIKPGKRITISGNHIPIFDGVIRDWNYSYEVGGLSIATAVCTDALGTLAAREFDEWTTSSQTADLRLTALLDRSEVVFGANRDFDTGVETLASDLVTHGSNVLNYAQLVVKSDLGSLFASRDGVLTFRNRQSNANETATSVIFTDEGGDIPYTGIAQDYGSEFLYNRVTVDREGGTAQTAVDSTSEYELSTLSLTGLLLTSDLRSQDYADYLLGLYSEPELRLSQVTVQAAALPADQQADLLSLDIGDLVQVRHTPNGVGGGVVQRYAIVEGLSHEMLPMYHLVTVALTSADRRRVFILDSDVYGLLNGANGVLAL
jgi:hypothetical protein